MANFRGPFLVDAHVHLHPVHPIESFLEGASGNLDAQSRRLGLQNRGPGVLLFAETAEEGAFRRLRRAASRGQLHPWSVESTAEPESLVVRKSGVVRFVLVGGRQLVTREQLEVLALGCTDDIPEGLAIGQTVSAIRAYGGLPVLPWGFGKWWFRRGAVVRKLLESEHGEIYLADSAVRPRIPFRSRLFALAARKGIVVLAGTDPLPLEEEAGKAGSYGFIVEGVLERLRPAESLKSLLRGRDQPPIFGDRTRLHVFLRQQYRLLTDRR